LEVHAFSGRYRYNPILSRHHPLLSYHPPQYRRINPVKNDFPGDNGLSLVRLVLIG
jgi:hypothetical protein